MNITPNQLDASLAVLDSYSVRAVARNRRLYLTLARVVRELNHLAEARDQEMNMLLRAFGKKDDKGQLQVPNEKLVEHGKKVYEYLVSKKDTPDAAKEAGAASLQPLQTPKEGVEPPRRKAVHG